MGKPGIVRGHCGKPKGGANQDEAEIMDPGHTMCVPHQVGSEPIRLLGYSGK